MLSLWRRCWGDQMVIRGAGWLAVLLGLASPAPVEGCRLALLLALDVSGSVTPSADLLQRQGLARALLAPAVSEAVLRGEPVALRGVEWVDAFYQRPLLPEWHMIRNEEDLRRVGEAVDLPRAPGLDRSRRKTALGEALAHAHQSFDQGPNCGARTPDVSCAMAEVMRDDCHLRSTCRCPGAPSRRTL